MKRILLGLFAMCLAVPVIAATISGGGSGSGSGGGGSASAAGSTNAVQTNTAGLLADSGCTAAGASGKMTCANGFLASYATLTRLTSTNLFASNATITSLSVTNKTGTGLLVYGSSPSLTSPTMTAPTLGTPLSVNLVNASTVPATSLTGTVPLANGGTNKTTWTASRCVQVNAGATGLESASNACGVGASGASSSGASGVVQSADGSGGLVPSGCTSLNGQLTCPGGFVAGTSSLGVIGIIEGTGTVAGTTSGKHNCWMDSTSNTWVCFENGAASQATYVTTQVPATFWNKTYNTEATGNFLSVVRKRFFPAAGANGTTGGSVWDLPTSNPAVASAIQGTNVIKGVLNFASASQLSAQMTDHLPSTWDGGTVDAVIAWMATPTTGTTIFSLQTVCAGRNETDDSAFNATGANNTVTSTVSATSMAITHATITGLTMTGCAPDETIHYKLMRSSGAPGGTMNAQASFYWLEIWYRELLRKVAL